MAPSKIYLLLWDTDENVHVLYRHDGDDRPTYIPPGEDYFEVDDAVGVDTFFLLASAEPLAELDRLLDRYEVAVGQTERVALGQQIVGEIRKQHKAHRDFARAVEKPVMIGGATREVPRSIIDAIDRLAIEVASDGFYSKTISIDHRLERGAR
ncbi:MAG: DUF4384 domain-containing protein [Actinomycetia bacterium]|nr:DUF4384 domain-containing protein [Actinomycetes bacterium]